MPVIEGEHNWHYDYDGLGSVRQLVDASGSVGLAQTFDPYGNGYAKAESAASSLGFTGEQTDANGFFFLRARYYQPTRSASHSTSSLTVKLHLTEQLSRVSLFSVSRLMLTVQSNMPIGGSVQPHVLLLPESCW